MTRGRIPSAAHGARALCSAVVLCWTALLLAWSTAPSPREAQPSVGAVAAAESATFVALAPVRHVASADAPRWRAPWPVVPAALPAQVGDAREVEAGSATPAPPCVRAGGRLLHGYDAAAPPLA